MREWKFEKLNGLRSVSRDTISMWTHEVHGLFLNGFESDREWPRDAIETRLRKTDILGILRDEQGAALGYAMYLSPDAELHGYAVLWEDAICLAKDDAVRGHHLSTKAIEQAMRCFPGRTFGWLGGRTQSPTVFVRYRRWGPTMFPVDQDYESPEGHDVMAWLLASVPEAFEAKEFDRRTGVCRRQYAEGRLGKDRDDILGSEVFWRRLAAWGFDRDAGDAVILMTQLAETVVIPSDDRRTATFHDDVSRTR
jgi:hypothetical protein